MSFVIANGLALHYGVDGTPGAAPLVLVNSLGTNLHLWDALVPTFAQSFRVVRYDKRGHGLSDTPLGPYAIRDHAADLAALLAHLGITNLVLAGISVGGLVALDFARQYPERVRALVLCDTAARIGTPEGWNDRIAALREGGMAGLAGTILDRWFAPGFAELNPAAFRGLANMLLQTPLEGYIATCAALRDADLSDSVHKITAPALVLRGAEDAVVPGEQARALAGALPNARLVEVERAAHLPCIEQPEAMAAAMMKFFQETGHAR